MNNQSIYQQIYTRDEPIQAITCFALVLTTKIDRKNQTAKNLNADTNIILTNKNIHIHVHAHARTHARTHTI